MSKYANLVNRNKHSLFVWIGIIIKEIKTISIVRSIFFLIGLLNFNPLYAQEINNLKVLPGSCTYNSATIMWNKTEDNERVLGYEVYQNNHKIGRTEKNYWNAGQLRPLTEYRFLVKVLLEKSGFKSTNVLTIKTRAKGKIFNVLNFGARGDGKTINTKQIQSAIDTCTKEGTVYIPAGTFITGALFVNKSNITIFLEKGAVLQASHILSDFPIIQSRYEGRYKDTYSSVITCGVRSGDRIKNIRIRGLGIIDGQGEVLSPLQTDASGRMSRSHGLLMLNCDSVYLEGFTIQNSPTWCIHPIFCNHLTTEKVFVKTDGYGVSNADGWDPDSSSDCYLIDSEFWTHDDCIAIKSGSDAEGRKIGKSSEDIYIYGCTFHKGGGLAIGSEMSGGIRRVYVNDCIFESVDRGFNIKTRRMRGGIVEDVVIKNITAERFGNWGINLEMFYSNGDQIAPQSPEATPVFRNFRFENIHIKTTTGAPILISGLPESKINNVVFKNIQIDKSVTTSKIMSCEKIIFQDVLSPESGGQQWNWSDTSKIVFKGATKFK